MSEVKIFEVWIDRRVSQLTFTKPTGDHIFPGSSGNSDTCPVKFAEIICRNNEAWIVSEQLQTNEGTQLTIECLKIIFRPEEYTGSKPFYITLAPFMAFMAAQSNLHGLFLSPYKPQIDLYNSISYKEI